MTAQNHVGRAESSSGGKILVAQRLADSPGAIVIITLEYARKRLLAWHPETAALTA